MPNISKPGDALLPDKWDFCEIPALFSEVLVHFSSLDVKLLYSLNFITCVFFFLVLKYGITNDLAICLNLLLAYSRNVQMDHQKDVHSLLFQRTAVLSDASHKYYAYYAW